MMTKPAAALSLGLVLLWIAAAAETVFFAARSLGLIALSAIAISATGLFGREAQAIPIQPHPLVEVMIDQEGTLLLSWTGKVVTGMNDFIRTTYEKHGPTVRRVVLHIDSVGGEVEEGERVIQTLRRIKADGRRLITFVGNGDICASFCVPIFLQGSERVAGLASVWLVHQVTFIEENGKVHLDRDQTTRIFTQYFLPAGVSASWIRSITAEIHGNDLWFSGKDLVTLKTNIITRSLAAKTRRPEAV
jgi:hypothetical protein